MTIRATQRADDVSDVRSPSIDETIPAKSRWIPIEATRPADVPTSTYSADTELFLRMVQEDSNLEMDWLWLATQVSSIAQRRYALKRALRINPHSTMAKRWLARIGW